MFLKNSKIFSDKSGQNSLSIITEGIEFSGEINTDGDIHLDGSMKGIIKAHEVVIGPNGNFDGEIISEVLKVSGLIKGKFTIKNLFIKKDGLLQGKAKYEVIVVDSGGRIQGELGLQKQNKSNNNKSLKDTNTNP
tara:strand:- start:1650 stop:2054 length:405 start_codon:yes stop_codon:yes gene_type:complete